MPPSTGPASMSSAPVVISSVEDLRVFPSSIPSPPVVISSVEDLRVFLSSLSPSNTLYIDLEGYKLSRHGTISLITTLVYPEKVVRLVDVQTLQGQAFAVTAATDGGGATLKSILENPSIRKCFWDVRNDANALWALHGVGLAGVLDVQLLENATRAGDTTYVKCLGKAIQADLRLGFMARDRWQRTKSAVTDKMTNKKPFDVRPLDDQMVQYCINDVMHLPALRDVYTKRIKADDGGACLARVEAASAARVAETRLAGYDPQAASKTLGPWGTAKKVDSLEEMLEMMEEQREEAIDAEIFWYNDDMRFDNYDDYDDDEPTKSWEAVWDDALDSCWDNGS